MRESLLPPADFDFADPDAGAVLPLGGPGPDDPTPEEIKAACAAFREEWDEARWEEQRRPMRLELVDMYGGGGARRKGEWTVG